MIAPCRAVPTLNVCGHRPSEALWLLPLSAPPLRRRLRVASGQRLCHRVGSAMSTSTVTNYVPR